MSSPRSAKQWPFEAALAHGNTKAEPPFESCEKPGKQKVSARAGEWRGGEGGETLKTGPREKDGPPGSQKGGKHSLTACDFCQTADRLGEDLFVCVCGFSSAPRCRHITGTPHSLRRLYFPTRRAKTFLKCRRSPPPPHGELSFNWPRRAHFGLSFPVQIYTSPSSPSNGILLILITDGQGGWSIRVVCLVDAEVYF